GIACVVPFLDEERHLASFLRSIERQTRFPDELLLIDDGSRDSSAEIAAAFAAGRPRVRLLRRPRRPPERDRLALAPELRAFRWGLARLAPSWELAVKMDADLQLAGELFATL